MSSSDEEFELNYGFEDEQKIARLKSVDNDGKFIYRTWIL